MIDIDKLITKELKKIAGMINNRVRKPNTSVYIPSVILPMALPYLNETAINKLVYQYGDGSITDSIYLITDKHLFDENYSDSRLLLTKYVHYLSDTCKGRISFEQYLIDDFRNELEGEIAEAFYNYNHPDLFDCHSNWPEFKGHDEYVYLFRNWLALNCLHLSYFHDGILTPDEIVKIYIHTRGPTAHSIEWFLNSKYTKLKNIKNTIGKIRVLKTSSTYDLIFRSPQNTFIYQIPIIKCFFDYESPYSLPIDSYITSSLEPPEYEGITLTDDGLTLLEMLKFDQSNYFEKEPMDSNYHFDRQTV